MTFHAKTCFNGFPFSNGIPFESRLKEICDLGHPFRKNCIHSNSLITRSVETSSHSYDLLTRSVETSSHSKDLLTHLVKTSIRSNDFLTHSIKTSHVRTTCSPVCYKHPTVQMTRSPVGWNIHPFKRLEYTVERL